MTGNTELAELTEKFRRATAQLTIRGAAASGLQRQLSDAATQLGIQAYNGTITALGQDSNGEYLVTFEVPSTNTSYISGWPQWAFQLAQAALLGSKEILVVANGDPFGPNLVEVYIIA